MSTSTLNSTFRCLSVVAAVTVMTTVGYMTNVLIDDLRIKPCYCKVLIGVHFLIPKDSQNKIQKKKKKRTIDWFVLQLRNRR